MLQVLAGEARSIRIEEPGVDGAEFYLQFPTDREYWQAKRQTTGQTTWSLGQLHAQGVLQFFWTQFRAGNRCVFASVSDAPALRVLIENAKAADSLDEFRAQFSGKKRQEEFSALAIHLGKPDDEEVFAFLRAIELHGSREITLEEELIRSLAAWFSGEGRTTLALLRDLYAQGSHQTFNASALEAHLSGHGITRRSGSAADTSQRIREITRTYVSSQHAKLIRGNMIRRSVADQIVSNILQNPGSSRQLVTASAGGGKSGCLCQITEALEDKGLLVLAFRLDRLEPVPTPRLLGEGLGLGESPPISLLHAAGDKPVVLIIDQIDCVSTTSGRREDFFDTLAALTDEISALMHRSKIHLVLACRKFDYEHDHRIKRLLPTDQPPIELGEFSDSEVQKVVASEGGDWTKLNARQQALLRLPQNLSLFVDAGVSQRSSRFATQKDLFDAYWRAKRRAVSEGRPDFEKLWLPAIKVMSESMSGRQELSLPASELDDFPSAFLDRMSSEGVITFDGRRYGFGHESFFDYCFARTLPNGGRDFVEYLKTDPQLLFRRAQLRQVLAFLRDDSHDTYLSALADLLSSGSIRPHLKLLAIEWLANHPDPSDAEFNLLMPWIELELDSRRTGQRDQDRLASRIWDAFFSSRNLFLVADRIGVIQQWLYSEESWLGNLMAAYLRWQSEAHAGRIAELIEPSIGRGGDWIHRLRHLMEGGALEKDQRFFDLFLRLLHNGALDEARDRFVMNGTFWTMIHGLVGKHPERFAEVAGKWLDRQMTIALSENENNDFRQLRGRVDGQSGVNDLKLCAKSAPRAVLDFILPAVLRAANAFAYDDVDSGELRRDRLWALRFTSAYPGLRETFPRACELAMESIGATTPHSLRPIIAELKTHRLHTANHLLLTAYLSAPATFADEALDLLASEQERLHCGFYGSDYWRAREVILKCSPHASEVVFRRLEGTLATFSPVFERSTSGFRERGHASFNLLSALASDRISPVTKIKIAEGERKFRTPDKLPRPIGAYPIVSPIHPERAAFMSDDHWLQAISKHRGQRRRFDRDHPERGGADELAGLLQNAAQQEPERFARLSLRFPDGTNSSYYRNTFYALKEAEIEASLKFEVVRNVFGVEEFGCLCAAIDLIGTVEGDQLPDDVARFLIRMAEHHDPEADETGTDSSDSGDAILAQGINSVRGHAFEAISKWIQKDRRFLALFSDLLVGALSDPTLAVRSCVAHSLHAAAHYDFATAFQWLNRLLDGDDRLLATPYVVDFLRWAIPAHFDDLLPTLQRMLGSECAAARREGAILACLGRLHHERAEDVALVALNGDTACRLGAAEVAATNLTRPDCREWCEQTLLLQFNDQDQEVRRVATECFWHLKEAGEIPLRDFDDLIRGFTASQSFAQDPSSLLYALEETSFQVPSSILDVCEAFVARCSDQARDLSTSHHGDEMTVGKLVFTAYAQLKGQAMQIRALDLIDQMILEGLYSASSQMAEVER
jgi:hypothetical protein